jgi:hypothetical protein
MRTLSRTLAKLQQIDRERGPTYVAEFEAVLADIAILKERTCIKKLVDFLMMQRCSMN